MEFAFQILLVVLLVFLNGFFVASEFALVGVRKTRIDELVRKGNKAALLVQYALKNLDSFISATQLGITIASLALGWVGEPVLARLIEPFFSFLPRDAAAITSHTLAVAAAFSLITFLHIVLGELAPKTVALQKSELTSLIVIAPLTIFTNIFRPFIWLLNGAGALVLKVIGFKAPSGHQLVHSEEEIRMILAQSAAGGAIERQEVEMVYKVFRLSDTPIRNIMVPRTEVIAFNKATLLKTVIQKVKKNPHSRFPVYDDTIDDIKGFIHIKDIYKLALESKLDLRLEQTDMIREIISVPESKRADEVLFDIRKRRVHMAVVNDEYGGTSGIVTLEDVLESIVGEIQDEFEKPLKEIQKQPDGSYHIDGLTTLDKLQTKFNLPLRGHGYTTIGGLVFGLLGCEPKKGSVVQIGNIQLEVEAIEGRRIKTIRLKKQGK